MITFLEMCKEPGTLKVIQFIKILLNIVFTVIPIAIILLGNIDIFKNITSGKEETSSKNTSILIKRIINCVIIFLIPTIINITFDILEEVNLEYATCWTNADAKTIKTIEINNVEEALAKLEKDPSSKNIQEAELAINQVSDSSQRKTYEEKFEKMRAEINRKALEEREAKEKELKEKKAVKNSGSVSSNGNTQAKDFNELGNKAYDGDKSAQSEWIEKIAKIVQNAQHSKYGIKNSLIIAQIINESGWIHTPKKTNQDGSTLTNTCNNVIGINYDMGKKISSQTSAWSKNPQKCANSSVTQRDSNNNVYGTIEDMRKYNSLEECIEDYADLVYLYHPECKNNNNIECYRSFLNGYTPVASGYEPVIEKYKRIIKKFDLEKYDQ